MKLIYKKPLIFPYWAVFKSKDGGKRFYSPNENGVSFSAFDMLPHFNHIEMAGFEISSIISYNIDKNKRLKLYTFCVFPQIRIIPNETRGSLAYHFKNVQIGIKGAQSTVSRIDINGRLIIEEYAQEVRLVHTFYPSFDKKALIEKIEITNEAPSKKVIRLKGCKAQKRINKCFLVESEGVVLHTSSYLDNEEIKSSCFEFTVLPNEAKTVVSVYGADKLSAFQAKEQIEKREAFLDEMKCRLKITTPNDDINRMTELCKIRLCESIFNTKNGYMHSPGGGNYYAALWTNDECEYANPLFAYLGYEAGMRQSVNCYSLYSRLVSSDKALPTSIIACGDGLWNGAGDRGDTSMYLYGLCRYLLTSGDKELARKFLPSIERAMQYVESNVTENGVVKSDSDELENRFESGKANLSTSCITYDALISLSYLFKELGNEEKAQEAFSLSQTIKNGIEAYFGATVEGYETYRYCKEEERLRSWICLPLAVGINERREETVKALLSDKLYKNSAVLTRSGGKTYWDRSTLYALRGLFYSGEEQKACTMLEKYSCERLYGCHPPYPVEAFPEGNSAQLSSESALYLRIITEGVLGYRPTGFDSFELKPCLPEKWDNINIENIMLLGKRFDIKIEKAGGYVVTVNSEAQVINKGEKYFYTRR